VVEAIKMVLDLRGFKKGKKTNTYFAGFHTQKQTLSFLTNKVFYDNIMRGNYKSLFENIKQSKTKSFEVETKLTFPIEKLQKIKNVDEHKVLKISNELSERNHKVAYYKATPKTIRNQFNEIMKTIINDLFGGDSLLAIQTLFATKAAKPGVMGLFKEFKNQMEKGF